MAAISHGESKAWWGNKFSPKNSKWLQSNISETEKKVRAMVKILEEDADSFARRADMYYKRRPELMLLAKEFYGAYRALAERYDVAAGALRVATRSLADAFPNQTPPSLSLPDEPPSTPLSEPQTPDMPAPARSLFDTDELHKDKIGNSPNVHKKNSEGLKQVNDLFQGEPKARKGLSFQADKAQKMKHEDGVGLQMASLQKDIFHLSEETKRLKDQVLTEAERANKAEGELLTLKGNILHLSFEKDAACIECQSHSERLMNVELELAQAHSDLLRLREVEKLSQEQKLEVELLEKKVELQVMELEQLTEKLQEVEKSKLDSGRNVEKLTEQNLSSEMTIRKLQGKIGALEGRTEKLKREIQGLLENLHEMASNLSLSEEENKCLKEKLQETEATVSDLQIEIELLRNERENLEAEVKTLRGSIFKLKSEKEGVQRDFNQLKLEMAIEADMLRNAEKLNLAQQSELELLQVRLKSQEEDYRDLVREIGELNEQKITSEETLRELLRDLRSLKETKEKLEKEVVVHLREKETLQRDLSLQIQDTCDLSNKLQILTAQTEAAIKVNAVLKEAFTKYEIERGILSEKNAVLEKELSDTIVELKLLRERVSELESSEESLSNQISVHVSEKADLASYFSEIYEKNSALESSLFDVSEKLKASEASCQSLISQKSGLVAERDDLFCQVQNFKVTLKNLEEKHLHLSEERDLLQKHLQEVEQLLSSKSKEHERVLSSYDNDISMHLSEKENLESKVECLSHTINEISKKNSELESTLSQVNYEIEKLRGKLSESEESCRSLIVQKSTLVAEKGDLLSQVESMTAVIKSLEDKHRGLEENHSALSKERDFKHNQLNRLQELLSSKIVEHELNVTSFQDQIEYLSEMNSGQFSEIEHLSKKLKDSEVAHQLLINEKQDLLAVKDDLFSQVENITVAMKNLEEKHLSLSDERDLLQNNLKKLELLLTSKTEECENAVRSHEMHATTLGDQISVHVSEKEALATQIETLNHTINDVRSRNNELESSLSAANTQIEALNDQKSTLDAEIEGLKEKLKESEDCCWSVIEQKSVLIAERDELFSQVASIKLDMKNLEDEHSILEENHSSLSKERDRMQNHSQELELLLKAKIEELDSAVKSHEMHAFDLKSQISEHISEKTDLISGIQALNHKIEAISTKNCELESSLSVVNAEMEDMKKKLKEGEESCQSLIDQKSVLISEKNSLLLQVDSLTELLKNFEDKHAVLEQKHLSLSKDRDTTECQLKEFQELLNCRAEEHRSALQSHELHVATLQDQIFTHTSQIETLQNTIKEISRKNSSLNSSLCDLNSEIDGLNVALNESQEMCQSLLTERSALRCQKDDLSAQVHTMKRLCKQLEAKQEDLEENLSITSDERDLAVNRLNNVHNALFIKQEEHAMALKSHELHVADLQDQLLALVFEKASLSFQVTVLLSTLYEIVEKNSTLASSLSDVGTEKDNLVSQVESLTHVIQQQEEKHSILSEERVAMQNQLQELRALLDFKTQEHENQIHDLQERNQLTEENLEKEQVKNSSVSNHLFILERSLSDMVDQHLQVSQLTEQVISRLEEEERENMVLREQNKRLREGICEFTNALGIKNEDDMIEEVILPAISCKIKNVIKLKEEGEDLNICMDLELSVLTTILCQMGLDLTGLKLVKGVLMRELEIKENELRDLHRNLMHEVQTSKQREEAFKRKIKDLSSSLALSKNEISTLREKNETIGKELQLSVSECLMLQHLCSFFDSLSTERGSLLQTFSDEIASLKLEIINLNNKLGALDGENKSLKMSLSCLEEEFRANLIISEFNLIHTKDLYQELSLEKSGLEKEITILSEEKEKMQTEVYGLLSEFEKCQRHISSLVSEVIALAVGTAVYKDEVLELMTENEGLEIRALAQKKALMDGMSLRDTFIEGLNTKLLEMEGENKKLKAGLDAYLPLVESLRDCVSSLELHTLSLSRRLQASQLKQDKSFLSDSTSTELPSGVFELQNLITKIESLDESLIGTTNQLKPKLVTSIKESKIPHEGVRRQINLPESSTTKTREVGMKDIELDQVSSSSLYGASRGEITEVDDHMLKLWATDDGKPRKSSSVNEYDIQAVEEIRNGPYSSELTAEKELGVDRQIPGDMRKVLEKLSADEQRLSALKTGIEELKQKLEGSPKGKFPSSTEYDALKVQLSEAEEALTKQIEINKKATKNAEYYSEALDAVAEEQSEQRHVSRRKIAEVTQKASEKIGRLELELQKIQYVLLKVQEAHERRGKSAEKRARVLLRDYIYGRRKRLPLCGCIRSKNAQGGRD
ncbi:Kinase interacting (KIP1-like) family protein [Rhynchospora pubera]|uniref:Kinase interacting (KIP1-like) family protein n=1 Tax=Rhynchospora pubera TaxID=906938 RepID=A0AAV8HVG0_9POAL|nr:Kinase interacting (KIP1-like) family protein [Rhynchospora pubera]